MFAQAKQQQEGASNNLVQSIVKGKLGETLTAQMAPLQARELKPSTAITTVTTIITGQIGEKEPAISLVAQTGSYINGN